MAGKKPLSPSSYRKASEKHLKNQPKLVTGKAASNMAKAKARHYTRGDKLMKQVSSTLQQIAASHPNPKAKKQAKLALKKLGEAQNAFGTASLCQGGVSWNTDDT